jgi:plasmid stability protein
MASITIRNLPDDTKKRLRLRAAQNGRSLEAEARELLKAGVGHRPAKEETGADLFDQIRSGFEALGAVDLPLPVRRGRKVPDFK